MKNTLRLLLFAAVLSSAVISCTKEDDTTPSSGDDRDKFLGTWQVASDGSQSGHQTWNMSVVASSSAGEILLDNFDQIGTTNSVHATVNGNSFSIPAQYVSRGDTIKGSGTYNSNGTLSFNYSAYDGGASPVDNVTATAQR